MKIPFKFDFRSSCFCSGVLAARVNGKHLPCRAGVFDILVLFAIYVFSGLAFTPGCEAEVLKIGVLAPQSKQQSLAQWQPLVATLRQAITGRDFAIEAYTAAEFPRAIAGRKLDFVLANPEQYVRFSMQYNLSAPLGTLKFDESGQSGNAYGGVIFRRAEQVEINTLEDLRGKNIAVSSVETMSMHESQTFKLKLAGISFPQGVKLIPAGASNDDVIEAVLSGRADAGFVRAGVLEGMVRNGNLDMALIHILPHRKLVGIPVQISAADQLKWHLAALPHIDRRLARQIFFALANTGGEGLRQRNLPVLTGHQPAMAEEADKLSLPEFVGTPALAMQDAGWKSSSINISVALLSGLILLLFIWMLHLNRKLALEKNGIQLQMQHLQESAFRWKFAIEGSGGGLWDWDIEHDSVYFSPRWKELLGFSEAEIGDSLQEWEKRIHPDDKGNVLAALQSYLDGKSSGYISEHRIRGKDGNWKWVLDRGLVVRRNGDNKPLRLIGMHTDITMRRQTDEQFQQLAFYDMLTKLPNRRLLCDRLSQTIAASNRSGRYGAVMFLDLDNFKPINDTYGHAVGDMLLVETASRLNKCVREIDTVARFGGDEFVVMINGLDAGKDESAAQARSIAEKIRSTLAEPYLLKVQKEHGRDEIVVHKCTISIGIAVFINHEGCQDDILRWADAALYKAKNAGRNLIRFYEQATELPHIGISDHTLAIAKPGLAVQG